MRIFLTLTCLFLAAPGCQKSAAPIPDADPGGVQRDGSSAAKPEVTLQTLDYDGVQKLIASHRGKVVVVDCWSTSCEPCVREFPNLVKLHELHGAERVACISLSFDYEGIGEVDDVRDLVLGFLKKQNATFDNVLSSDESDVLYQKLELSAVPAVYVYGPNGELAKRFDNEAGGEFTYADVGPLVAKLLAGQEAAKVE